MARACAQFSVFICMSSLQAQNNQVSSIADEVSNLRRLSELYLTNNRITAVPKALCTLTHLQELHLVRRACAWALLSVVLSGVC